MYLNYNYLNFNWSYIRLVWERSLKKWVTWGWGHHVRFIIYWVSITLNTVQIYVSIWTVGFIYELCPLGSVSATDYSHNLWNFQFPPYAPEPLGPSVTGLIPNDKKCSKSLEMCSCCLNLFLHDLTLKKCLLKVTQVNSDILNNFFGF